MWEGDRDLVALSELRSELLMSGCVTWWQEGVWPLSYSGASEVKEDEENSSKFVKSRVRKRCWIFAPDSSPESSMTWCLHGGIWVSSWGDDGTYFYFSFYMLYRTVRNRSRRTNTTAGATNEETQTARRKPGDKPFLAASWIGLFLTGLTF